MEENGTNSTVKPASRIGFRHIQVLMLFVGLALAYSMRAAMSIAIIGMVNFGSQDPTHPKLFNWNFITQTIILAAFMAGHVISYVPGRRLVTRFGGKVFMVVGVGVSAAIAAFIPLGAYDGEWLLVASLRLLQGLAQGAMVPAILNLIENWIPLEEKKLTEIIILSGSLLGVCLQFLISGFMMEAWGWSSIFYMNTGAGGIWSIAYIIIGSGAADTSRFISESEKVYIKNSLKQDNDPKELKTPWYAIWTSVPFLTLVVAACARNWGLWAIITLLPMFLSHTYVISVGMIGVICAIPYMAMLLMIIPFDYASSWIIRRNKISVTTTRKLFSGIGLFGPGILLIVLFLFEADVVVTAVFFALVMALNAAQCSGFMMGPSDMAPNFSNRLRRVINGFADLLAIFAPLTAGMILVDETDVHWQYVFGLIAALYFVSGIIYTACGTSEKQRWNDLYNDSTNIRSPYLKQESRRD